MTHPEGLGASGVGHAQAAERMTRGAQVAPDWSLPKAVGVKLATD
jgi:hypothetical protein